PGVAHGAHVARMLADKGVAREDGDAVIALLALHGDVIVAGLMEGAPGKLVVRALGLLEAEDVRLVVLQEPGHEADPQPDRVDVPSGDGEGHGGSPGPYW